MGTRGLLLLTLALFAPQLGCGSDDDDAGRDAAAGAVTGDGGSDLGGPSDGAAAEVATGATVVGTL